MGLNLSKEIFGLGLFTEHPYGADVGELINLVKGTGPRDAKAATERWKEIVSHETEEEREERRHQLRSVRSAAQSTA